VRDGEYADGGYLAAMHQAEAAQRELETTGMPWVYDDGGRAAAGYKGRVRDCVTRAVCIATGMDYQEVYDALNELGRAERITKRHKTRSNARTGVRKTTTRKYMASIGWTWTPTMAIGQGCTVHLAPGELPTGILVAKLSRHTTAVIDGVTHDTYDPSRDGRRAVYGYYSKLPVDRNVQEKRS
jgi:hypothetical protein